MKEIFISFKRKYKNNPAWCWLLAIVFLFPILPEYVSPFILFVGYIVFKRQWTREGRKAKVGTIGKLVMCFLTYAVISTIWSDTKFSTFSTAMLWWGMFLVEIMIFNLARSRQKIDKILTAMVYAGSLNGLVGAIQICTYTLYKFDYISSSAVFVTPFYRQLDKAVYSILPFEISTSMWASRASGFYSNPNLLATYMILTYPISIYLFLVAPTKKKRTIYFISNVLISAGMSSTMTRAGCFIAIAGWIFMFIILIKKHWKPMLQIFIPTVCIIIPSILTRYGIIFKKVGKVSGVASAGLEAKRSSITHLQIWGSMLDFLSNNAKEFIIGTGFGVEQTGLILYTLYDLDKPHAHNFILETWAELGIAGVLLLLGIIICSFGKLLEINANNGKKFALVFCVFTSMLLYLLFGLTDYIFNSPKQIILLFMLLGLTQAMSFCYEKTVIKDTQSLMIATKNEITNVLHQV